MADNSSRVHRQLVRAIELGGVLAVSIMPEAVGTKFGVLSPEFFVRRERINHLGPFAIPFGMFVAVEDVVRHVGRADDRTRHDAADLLAGAPEAEHRAGQNAFACYALGDGTR
jgi:hypothetical protein